MDFGIIAILVSFVAYTIYQRMTIGELTKEVKQKEGDYKKLMSQKKSSEVRLGQISENLAPFLEDFKYNPKRAHFLGQPIDYIIFEDDEVIFLEIKSGMAQLNPVQKSIKSLIKNKKVRWDEMRINGLKANTSADAGDIPGVPETPGLPDTTKTDIQVQDVHVPFQDEIRGTADGANSGG